MSRWLLRVGWCRREAHLANQNERKAVLGSEGEHRSDPAPFAAQVMEGRLGRVQHVRWLHNQSNP